MIAVTVVATMVGCSGDNLQIVRVPLIVPVAVPALAPSPSLGGPNTSLHVVWSADGDLADLVITEE